MVDLIAIGFKYGMRRIILCFLPLQETACKGKFNVAKIQYNLRVASFLNLPWYENEELVVQKLRREPH